MADSVDKLKHFRVAVIADTFDCGKQFGVAASINRACNTRIRKGVRWEKDSEPGAVAEELRALANWIEANG